MKGGLCYNDKFLKDYAKQRYEIGIKNSINADFLDIDQLPPKPLLFPRDTFNQIEHSCYISTTCTLLLSALAAVIIDGDYTEDEAALYRLLANVYYSTAREQSILAYNIKILQAKSIKLSEKQKQMFLNNFPLVPCFPYANDTEGYPIRNNLNIYDRIQCNECQKMYYRLWFGRITGTGSVEDYMHLRTTLGIINLIKDLLSLDLRHILIYDYHSYLSFDEIHNTDSNIKAIISPPSYDYGKVYTWSCFNEAGGHSFLGTRVGNNYILIIDPTDDKIGYGRNEKGCQMYIDALENSCKHKILNKMKDNLKRISSGVKEAFDIGTNVKLSEEEKDMIKYLIPDADIDNLPTLKVDKESLMKLKKQCDKLINKIDKVTKGYEDKLIRCYPNGYVKMNLTPSDMLSLKIRSYVSPDDQFEFNKDRVLTFVYFTKQKALEFDRHENDIPKHYQEIDEKIKLNEDYRDRGYHVRKVRDFNQWTKTNEIKGGGEVIFTVTLAIILLVVIIIVAIAIAKINTPNDFYLDG